MVCLACLAPLATAGGLAGGVAVYKNVWFLWIAIILSILTIIWAGWMLLKK